MPSPENRAVIAVAGASKTQGIIDAALASTRRVLITTYTVENQRQLEARLAAQAGGVVPAHITICGWFTLLLHHGVKPYQVDVFGTIGKVRSMNFQGKPHQFAKIAQRQFFVDRNDDVFKDRLAHLACRANELSGGLVIERLEAIFDEIYVDEVQDLVGYDLEFLDLLLRSTIAVTVVGDPRQHTFGTNDGSKNKKYRGPGFIAWLDERADVIEREERLHSDRCHRDICEFASGLFPDLPALTASERPATGHDGLYIIEPGDVHGYVARWSPQILRWDSRSSTYGYPAMNFGVSKGSTFDRVLIIPTSPMKTYLKTRDASSLKAPEKFYVAVTRARHSVAFVVG